MRFALRPVEIEGVAIHSLDPGTTLLVNTRNSQYRLITLLDEAVVLVTGGEAFPDATAVQFVGALAGGTTVRVGWIQVGCRMEMWHGTRRVTSSPVRSIVIESVPVIPVTDHVGP
jgi:hypothetical protein